MLKTFDNHSWNESILVILFLISVIVFNNFRIGPFSVRVYAVIAMSLYLLYHINEFRHNRVVPITNSYIKLYSAFLVIFLLSLIANGEIAEYDYFRRLMAYHLVCFIAFYVIFLKVNNREQISLIAAYLLLIILINGVFTILQAFDNRIAWGITEIISPVEQEFEDRARNQDTFLGVSIFPGLFGGVVRNAYNLTSLLPLSMLLLRDKRFFVRCFALITVIIGFTAIYITQQRAAFYISIFILVLYCLATLIRKPISLLFSIVVLFLAGFYFEMSLSEINLGRLLQFDNNARETLWARAYNFIPNHILFGGPVEFQKEAGFSTHNLFFDSIIFSGIGGFIALMIFTIKVGSICIKKTIEYIKKCCSIMTFSLSMSMTACTLYGFTHNTSVLTGEVLVFILLSLLLKSIQLDKIQVE